MERLEGKVDKGWGFELIGQLMILILRQNDGVY